MINGKRVGAVVPAAGSGRRMGGVAKQFLEVNGKPLIWYSLNVLQQSVLIDRIVLAGPEAALGQLEEIVRQSKFSKVTGVVAGGEQRQDSVWNGICALPPGHVDLIAVHDAARPLLTQAALEQVVTVASESEGAILALPCHDTIKVADSEKRITGTLDRNSIWFAQTPQVFPSAILLRAYELARSRNFIGTDEAALVEAAGGKVMLVPGPKENFKVTTEEDLKMMEFVLGKA